mgnify:CR=1 FL=1
MSPLETEYKIVVEEVLENPKSFAVLFKTEATTEFYLAGKQFEAINANFAAPRYKVYVQATVRVVTTCFDVPIVKGESPKDIWEY